MSQEYDLVIDAEQSRGGWSELWQYRGLLFFLAWRDILVRYKQTVVGVFWSVLRPFLTMIVFTLIFGKLAGFPSEGGAPYAILVFSAMLPWQLFSSALSESSHSLVSNAGLVSKVYFPRMIIPFSAIAVSLVDFLISLAILGGLMCWYGFIPDGRIIFLPVFLCLALATALGAGLWLAALNVRYRDFRFVVPFIVQLGLYISPVGFSSTVIPQQWRFVYSLNPLVGVIDGFRWAILGADINFYWPGFLLSVVLIMIVLFGGIRYFVRTERSMADLI